MSGRCDGMLQCPDRSDEDECNLIKIDKQSYNKAYPPRTAEGRQLSVKVQVILVAIHQVNELDMTFGSELILSLEWYDERVLFFNLKEKELTNLIKYETANDIWIPPLIFNNSKQNMMVILDETSDLFVNKRSLAKMTKRSWINEDYFYKGADNIFVYRLAYEMTHSCQYNLQRYPFDTQTCQIEVVKYFRFFLSICFFNEPRAHSDIIVFNI